ncbi:citrate/2-methylcitrate synthase, partial [Tritonibacter sp. SIMBA_163]|uniref:citrate/2-methylcitrate synthase n=1 Tax=Tritonibacter sp. SIMBA_163 TaxID=3080868 RepID=UPI00397F2DB8
HPLYPQGDPRARALLGQLRARWNDAPAVDRAHRLALAAQDLAGTPPTVDFALALIGHLFNLPRDAPLTLFALGRTVG